MIEGGEASDKPIDSAVLSRMKQFRAMNKLKKLALKVGLSKNALILHCIFKSVVTLLHASCATYSTYGSCLI